MRSRPDREDYFFLGGIALVAFLLWNAYAYQSCSSHPNCALDSIKEWQDLLSGIMTIIAAFIGGYYVIKSNNKQIELLTDQFRETTRPYVIARLSTRAGVLFTLEIENTGQSPASDLRINLDKDFFPFGERGNLREAPAFTRSIPNFAPKEKLTFDLSQGFNMDNIVDGADRTPHQFSVLVNYNFGKRSYSESYHIDVEHYFSSLAVKRHEDHLDDIAKYLKKISETKR